MCFVEKIAFKGLLLFDRLKFIVVILMTCKKTRKEAEMQKLNFENQNKQNQTKPWPIFCCHRCPVWQCLWWDITMVPVEQVKQNWELERKIQPILSVLTKSKSSRVPMIMERLWFGFYYFSKMKWGNLGEMVVEMGENNINKSIKVWPTTNATATLRPMVATSSIENKHSLLQNENRLCLQTDERI